MQCLGSWSLLSLLLGMHPICHELAQGRAAQVRTMRCVVGDLASQRNYRGAHPLLDVRMRLWAWGEVKWRAMAVVDT